MGWLGYSPFCYFAFAFAFAFALAMVGRCSGFGLDIPGLHLAKEKSVGVSIVKTRLSK